MRITKLQSLLALSLTLLVGFASGYMARGFCPEQKSIAIDKPSITFYSRMPVWPSTTYPDDFTFAAHGLIGLDSLFDDMLRETFHPLKLMPALLPEATSFTLASTPEIDLHQTNDHLQLEVPMPGLKPEDVNVFMEGNKLVVKGHHKQQSQNGFSEQSLIRTVNAPFGVDLSRIKKHGAAEGVTVTIPRTTLSAVELPI